MKKLKIRSIIFLSILLILSLLTYITIRKTDVLNRTISSIDNISQREVAIGFWTIGFWDDNAKTLHPERMKKIENDIGKKIAIASYYRGWEFLNDKSLIKELEVIKDNKWVPMLSANPYFFPECESQGKTLYRAIADGDCDKFLHETAINLRSFNGEILLRFAWEMNVETIEWSIQRTGSHPDDFIEAWRRFREILNDEEVTNVLLVFCPQVETPSTIDIATLYPGDDYVDWVGLDGYNWGNTQEWSSWREFDDIFQDSYDKLLSISNDKPIMLCEVNSTSSGGDRQAWYKNMLNDAIPNKFTEIDAIIFFNDDKTHLEGVNWLFEQDPTAITSFKNLIDNPIYTSHLYQ